MKINIRDISYENVICDKGHVKNLEYPVSQRDLDSLCKRLPRFCNSMGELFLYNETMDGWFHTVRPVHTPDSVTH